MKQVTIQIPDDKFSFFMELIKSLKFVKRVETSDDPSKAEIMKGLQHAVEEVNLVKAGKHKAQPLSEFLNEL